MTTIHFASSTTHAKGNKKHACNVIRTCRRHQTALNIQKRTERRFYLQCELLEFHLRSQFPATFCAVVLRHYCCCETSTCPQRDHSLASSHSRPPAICISDFTRSTPCCRPILNTLSEATNTQRRCSDRCVLLGSFSDRPRVRQIRLY